MRPSLSGWPSSVTSPVTVPVLAPDEQPAAASAASPARIMSLSILPALEIGRRFAAVHRAQGLPGGQVDGIRDETDRAVAQADVDAVGMPAAGRLVAIGAGRAG